MDDAIRIAERWYVLASSSRADDRTRVLKHGETFAVFDRFGDVQLIGTGEHGIYHQGSRYLSHLELRLNGERPMLLNSSVKQDNFLLTVHLTTTDFCEEGKITVLKGTVHVARARLLWMAACHELLGAGQPGGAGTDNRHALAARLAPGNLHRAVFPLVRGDEGLQRPG